MASITQRFQDMEIEIYPAEHSCVFALTNMITDSFKLDESVKLMHTREEIWPHIQEILHDCINVDAIQLRLAVARDTRHLVGFISYGVIPPASGFVPEFAFNDLTVWATQKLLEDSPHEPRYILATELQTRSRDGQSSHVPTNRLVINTLVTAADCRGRGVATQLLRCAIDRAREADCPVWVQAPTISEGVFRQQGFLAVNDFVLDLSDFATEEQRARMTTGSMIWVQMRLETQTEVLAGSEQ